MPWGRVHRNNMCFSRVQLHTILMISTAIARRRWCATIAIPSSVRAPLNQIVDITMPAQLVNAVGEGYCYLLLPSALLVGEFLAEVTASFKTYL